MPEFMNRMICGDCIEVLGSVGEPFADLIFADPPFNIGYKYDKYYDKLKRKNYIAWTREWMRVCRNVLKPHSSFFPQNLGQSSPFPQTEQLLHDSFTRDSKA